MQKSQKQRTEIFLLSAFILCSCHTLCSAQVKIQFEVTSSLTINEGSSFSRFVCHDLTTSVSDEVSFTLTAYPAATSDLSLSSGNIPSGARCVSVMISTTSNQLREDTKTFQIILVSTTTTAAVDENQDRFILNIWDTDPISSTSNSCPSPTAAVNGVLTAACDVSAGSICVYQCYTGYGRLTGSLTRTCSSDSLKWNDNPLFCSQIKVEFQGTEVITINEGEKMSISVCRDSLSPLANDVPFTLTAFPEETSDLILPSGNILINMMCATVEIRSRDNDDREDTKTFQLFLKSSAAVNENQDRFILNVMDDDDLGTGTTRTCPLPRTLVIGVSIEQGCTLVGSGVCMFQCNNGFRSVTGSSTRTCNPDTLRWNENPLFCMQAVKIGFVATAFTTITINEGRVSMQYVCRDSFSPRTNVVPFTLTAFPDASSDLILPFGSIPVAMQCIQVEIRSISNINREDTKTFQISLSSTAAAVDENQEWFILNIQDDDPGTGTPVVCPAPAAGVNGELTSACSPSAGSICVYQCSNGHGIFSGSFTRTCDSVTLQWNGTPIFCTQTDFIRPIVSCGPDITEMAPSGGVTVTFEDCTATDESGDVTLVSQSHMSGDLFQIGSTTVTYRFTDLAGNEASNSFTINVVEDFAPVFENCPQDESSVTVYQNVAGMITIVFNRPSCRDLEDGRVGTLCEPDSNTVTSRSSTHVTCTCTDSQGSTDQCIFSIPANRPPVEPVCPNNMVLAKASGNTGARASFDIPTCDDQEQRTAFIAVCSPNSGEFFTLGSTSVTCTCTDLADSSSSCSFIISVREVQCPLDVFETIEISSTVTTVSVTWNEPSNPESFVLVSRTHNSGSSFPIGETHVTYTFRDQANNAATCTFVVSVFPDCKAVQSPSAVCNTDQCSCDSEEVCNPVLLCRRSCSVFDCLAGLEGSVSSKVNPWSSLNISCSLTGAKSVVEKLFVILTRNNLVPFNQSGISQAFPAEETPGRKQTNYIVQTVTEMDNLYCILLKDGFVIGSLNVTGFVNKLPQLGAAPLLGSKSNTSATIEWKAWDPFTDIGDPPVVHYIPYYRMSTSDEWIRAPVMVVPRENLEYKAEDLEVDTLYDFSVAAVRVGDNGEGPRSPSVTVKTYCNVPEVTAEVTAHITSSSGVNVSWQLPLTDVKCSTGVTKFTIYYRIEGSSDDRHQEAGTVNDTSMKWFVIDEGSLMPGTNYSFFVTFTTDQPSFFSKKTEKNVLQVPPLTSTEPPVAVIGGAVGAVVIVLLLLLFILLVIKRRRSTESSDNAVASKPADNTYDNPVFGVPDQPSTSAAADKPPKPEKPSQLRASKDYDTQSVDNISEDGGSPPIDDGIYGNLEPPQPIRVTEFGKYVKQNMDKVEQEFSILGGSTRQFDWTVAENPANKKKNRFKNMYTYDHSRVVLTSKPDEESSDYYNASFIQDINGDDAYIASQAPNRASLDDFVRMIWEQKVTTIVMVANLYEDGKERCLKYWPESEGSRTSFGSVTVAWTKTTQCSDFVIRYLVFKRGKVTREVQQLHFLAWPDKDTPEHGTALIEFAKQSKLIHQGKKNPMLVHCSAGIGRTGTFICLSCMMDVLRDEEYIDVFSFVNKMRQNRINMVQTSKQYVFLYKCLYEYYLTHHTEMSVGQMIGLDVEAHRDSILVEFELLSELGHTHRKDTIKNCVGKKKENMARNRVGNMVPSNRNRVFLMSPGQANEGDYINASYVKSFQKKDAFITTQSPLPNTIEDFWRMVYDVKSPVIVMLNQLDSTDMTCVQYWPDRGSCEYGNMSVTCVATERQSGFTTRSFEVSHVNSKDVLPVTHMQMDEWRPDINLQDIVRLIKEVDMIHKRHQFTQPTVIHCINGFERSGIMVTIKSELQRAAVTDRVNVFNTVKKLRDQHEHMLKNKDDYILCFHLLKAYLASSNSNYENSDDIRRETGM